MATNYASLHPQRVIVSGESGLLEETNTVMRDELVDGAIRPAPGTVRGMDNGAGPRAARGAGATETICLV